MAVTDGARDRLENLREAQAEAAAERESVSVVEIVRLQRDEVGSRIVPLAGVYAEALAAVRSWDAGAAIFVFCTGVGHRGSCTNRAWHASTTAVCP